MPKTIKYIMKLVKKKTKPSSKYIISARMSNLEQLYAWRKSRRANTATEPFHPHINRTKIHFFRSTKKIIIVIV